VIFFILTPKSQHWLTTDEAMLTRNPSVILSEAKDHASQAAQHRGEVLRLALADERSSATKGCLARNLAGNQPLRCERVQPQVVQQSNEIIQRIEDALPPARIPPRLVAEVERLAYCHRIRGAGVGGVVLDDSVNL